MPFIVESDTTEGRIEGKYRTVSIKDFKEGKKYGYILDIDPESFNDPVVVESISGARTIFVNAVMGYTPHFAAGSEALDKAIDGNRIGDKDVRRWRHTAGVQEPLSGSIPLRSGQHSILFLYGRRDGPHSHRTGQPLRAETGSGITRK